MIEKLNLIKANNKWFIMIEDRCIAKTFTLAIHFGLDEITIRNTLVNEFNAKLERPIGGISSKLNSLDTTPWFDNESDGQKSLEWLDSLKTMSKIRQEFEENNYPDADIDFNHLRRNDYIELIKNKFSKDN